MRLRHDRTLITGKPGVGKTTLVQTIVARMTSVKMAGFYTAEIRSKGSRLGFEKMWPKSIAVEGIMIQDSWVGRFPMENVISFCWVFKKLPFLISITDPIFIIFPYCQLQRSDPIPDPIPFFIDSLEICEISQI
jgi:hypothetical protein